jgi:hypothetical protein
LVNTANIGVEDACNGNFHAERVFEDPQIEFAVLEDQLPVAEEFDKLGFDISYGDIKNNRWVRSVAELDEAQLVVARGLSVQSN